MWQHTCKLGPVTARDLLEAPGEESKNRGFMRKAQTLGIWAQSPGLLDYIQSDRNSKNVKMYTNFRMGH